MAIVPLYNQGQRPKTGARYQMAMAPQGIAARQSVQTGGLARAGQMPTEPVQPHLAPSQGTAAIGGAVARLGGLVSQWAEAERKLRDTATMGETAMEWQQTQAEFAERMQTMPETEWTTAWGRELERLEARTAEAPVSRQARERLSLEWQRFAGESTLRIKGQANRQMIDRARMAGENAVNAAVRAGDLYSVQWHVEQMIDSGAILPEQGQRMVERAEQTHLRETMQRLLVEDPLSLAAELDRGAWPTVKGAERDRMKQAAARAAGQRREELRGQLVQRIATGDIVLGDDITNHPSGYLLDEDREALRSFLESPGADDPGEFGDLLREVALYDPRADAEGTSRGELTNRVLGSGLEKNQIGQLLESLGTITLAVTEEDTSDAGPPTTQDPTQVWTDHRTRGMQIIDRMRDEALAEIDEGDRARPRWSRILPGDQLGTWEQEQAQMEADRAEAEARRNQERVDFLRWLDRARAEGQQLQARDIDEWFHRRHETAPIRALDIDEGGGGGFDGWLWDAPEAAPEAEGSVETGALPIPADPAQVRVRGRFDVEPDALRDTLPEPLQPLADEFVRAGRRHGVNPAVLAAISAHETAGGTSRAFRDLNNAMGVSNASGPTRQASHAASIERMARLLGSTTGGPYRDARTLEDIGRIYAPPGAGNDPRGLNPGWAAGVQRWLRQLQS